MRTRGKTIQKREKSLSVYRINIDLEDIYRYSQSEPFIVFFHRLPRIRRPTHVIQQDGNYQLETPAAPLHVACITNPHGLWPTIRKSLPWSIWISAWLIVPVNLAIVPSYSPVTCLENEVVNWFLIYIDTLIKVACRMIDRQLSIFTNVISFLTFVYIFGGQYKLQIRVSFFFFRKNDWLWRYLISRCY